MMLSAKQAGAMLGVSSSAMYALAAPAGPLACFRIGRRVVFEEKDVAAFKGACRHTQAPPLKIGPSSGYSVDRNSLRAALRTPEDVAKELRAAFRSVGIDPDKPPSSRRRRPVRS